MRIVYPYNEILPKKKAHDVFIFDECTALAKEGNDITLLCGKGSIEDDRLFQHYHALPGTFKIERLPIVRKNNPFNLSWNFPFFFFSQKALRRLKPDWVFLSVRKQGIYHLTHKIPGIRYLYEVHELAYYPGNQITPLFQKEREMLNRADLVTVTTKALQEILTQAPYSLSVPVEVVPLAVKKEPLPPPGEKTPLVLMYIGQLYEGQGIPHLLAAAAKIEGIKIQIVGGNEKQIAHFKKHSSENVEFLGFFPPSQLAGIAQNADAFVAPFNRMGRMPYVAHTKLFEYAHWGRPIIAPRLPSVEEHFSKGVLLFEPDNISELINCINQLKIKEVRERLQKEIYDYSGRFSWSARIKKYNLLINY